MPTSVAEIDLLETLGDQRAFTPLRRAVRRGSPSVAARAAVALTRLGHFETVPLALRWTSKRGPRQVAAAEILSLARHHAAADAISALLASPESAARGLRFAAAAPLPTLVGALAGRLDADDANSDLAAVALGNVGSNAAFEALATRFDGPRGVAVAAALARRPGSTARDFLVHRLGAPGATRIRALRALAVRHTVLGGDSDEASTVAATLLSSKDATERAAAATWLAATTPERRRDLVESRDPVVVRAAMRWVRMGPAADRAAKRLATETDAALVTALSASLVSDEAADVVPRRRLLDLVERHPAAAPLAARALGARQDDATAPDVERLLGSPNVVVRAQVALGLGRRPDAAALGWLERAYRFETEGDVRLAIVRATSRRPEGARRRLLEFAARLDPDVAVRSAAVLGLKGILLDEGLEGGCEAVWVTLGKQHTTSAAAWVQTSAGTVLPMSPDPDGIIVGGALPAGPVGVRVAFAPEGGQAR